MTRPDDARTNRAAQSDPHPCRTWSRASPTGSSRSSRSWASATAPARGAISSSVARLLASRRRQARGHHVRGSDPIRISVRGYDKQQVGQVRAAHPQTPSLQGQGCPLRRRAWRKAGKSASDRSTREREGRRWLSPNPSGASGVTAVRKGSSWTAQRPRLAVFRSNKHVYAQAIDDIGPERSRRADGRAVQRTGPTATVDAGEERRAALAQRRGMHRRLRPRWIQLSRPHCSGRRRCPRGGLCLLMAAGSMKPRRADMAEGQYDEQ